MSIFSYRDFARGIESFRSLPEAPTYYPREPYGRQTGLWWTPPLPTPPLPSSDRFTPEYVTRGPILCKPAFPYKSEMRPWPYTYEPETTLVPLSQYQQLLQTLENYRQEYQKAQSFFETLHQLFPQMPSDPAEFKNFITTLKDRAAFRNSYDFVTNIVGREYIIQSLSSLCPYTPERQNWVIVIEESSTASMEDYSEFLSSIAELYKTFLTLIKADYFLTFWVEGGEIEISHEDELRIREISRKSPEEVKVSALGVALQTLGEALLIGKQWEHLKKAGVEVNKAKLELRKKEWEFSEMQKEAHIKDNLRIEEAELALEEKRLKIEEMRNKLRMDMLNYHKALREESEKKFESLAKIIKVINGLPKEMQEMVSDSIQKELMVIVSSPYNLLSFQPESSQAQDTHLPDS